MVGSLGNPEAETLLEK